jgi:hypothetical protein
MKLTSSSLLAGSAMAVAALGIQDSYAADILSEAPPIAAPYYGRGYGYQAPEYPAPGYEPAPPPQYQAYGESRYESAPVPSPPIYREPDYGPPVYAAPGPRAYEPRVYAAPAYQYPPAHQCYWTRDEPVWNGYTWSRRPVQVCN